MQGQITGPARRVQRLTGQLLEVDARLDRLRDELEAAESYAEAIARFLAVTIGRAERAA